MESKIGKMLVAANMITPEQLQTAMEYQKKDGKRLGYNLIKLGFVSENDVTSLLCKQYGIPSINLYEFEISQEVLSLIDADLCKKYSVIPVSRSGATLTIAMADPSNLYALDDIKFKTGYNVQAVVASEVAIDEAIEKHFTLDMPEFNIGLEENGFSEDIEVVDRSDEIDTDELENSQDASIINFVNKILVSAVRKGASDIHLEPYENEFIVRFRIDGELYEIIKQPIAHVKAVISRIKILAELNIAEKRVPQDGRIEITLTGKNSTKKTLDLRVSILPCLHGEKAVLRILDKENLMLDLTKLGLEHSSLEILQKSILMPYGMILITGPTGSGKTNTLYSALGTINEPNINITTAEDPVEFSIERINQVQMNEKVGLNFSAALRSFLRQDPDIIMVGEIRDFETAEIAIKAALTGHLVLSTLHTNDAAGTISRLMNMGIEPFLVATSLLMIGAQRLVRKLCDNCKEHVEVPMETLTRIGFSSTEASEINVFAPVGCPVCNNSGYKGRIGIFEVMEITDNIRELILSGATAIELKRQAIEDGMITLRRSGLEKLQKGITSIEEVITKSVL